MASWSQPVDADFGILYGIIAAAPFVAFLLRFLYKFFDRAGYFLPTVEAHDFDYVTDAYAEIAYQPNRDEPNLLRGPISSIVARSSKYERLIFMSRNDYFYMEGIKLAFAGTLRKLPSAEELLKITTFGAQMARATRAMVAMLKIEVVRAYFTKDFVARGRPRDHEALPDWYWRAIQEETFTLNSGIAKLKTAYYSLIKTGYFAAVPPKRSFRLADGALFFFDEPVPCTHLNIYSVAYTPSEVMALYPLTSADVQAVNLPINVSNQYLAFHALEKYMSVADNIVAASRGLPVLYEDDGLPTLVTYEHKTTTVRVFFIDPLHTTSTIMSGFSKMVHHPRGRVRPDVFSAPIK